MMITSKNTWDYIQGKHLSNALFAVEGMPKEVTWRVTSEYTEYQNLMPARWVRWGQITSNCWKCDVKTIFILKTWLVTSVNVCYVKDIILLNEQIFIDCKWERFLNFLYHVKFWKSLAVTKLRLKFILLLDCGPFLNYYA